MTSLSGGRAFSVVGGGRGNWLVVSQRTLLGEPISKVSRIDVVAGALHEPPGDAVWVLRGVVSNDRYTTSGEKCELSRRQTPVGRISSTCSALILLQKSQLWWSLSQDERRAIFEEQSHHIAIGMRYLPSISRRLLHCRDMGTREPFDFIGILDFAPSDESAFEELMEKLRSSREWAFMEREIDIRLEKVRSGSTEKDKLELEVFQPLGLSTTSRPVSECGSQQVTVSRNA